MSFNVLIVDDSFSMRSVIKKVLSMSGFHMDQCFDAANGREGLAVLGKEWVDVILSDINMPEMNGLEMLRKMKENPVYQHIPVIVISTEGSEDRINEAFCNGAKGFIKKPFLPEDLKKILHDVLGVDADGSYADDQKDSDDLDF
jgi:two-component system, chemotaxis family, chemotaxis protein CheY